MIRHWSGHLTSARAVTDKAWRCFDRHRRCRRGEGAPKSYFSCPEKESKKHSFELHTPLFTWAWNNVISNWSPLQLNLTQHAEPSLSQWSLADTCICALSSVLVIDMNWIAARKPHQLARVVRHWTITSAYIFFQHDKICSILCSFLLGTGKGNVIPGSGDRTGKTSN